MAAEQAAENHVDDRGLTWYFRRGIYTSIPTLTHPQISLAAVEALRWSSLKWSERASQSVLVISFAMKQDIVFWVYWKVNGNWENNMSRIFQWREAIVEQIPALGERSKFKRAGLRVTVRDPSRKVHQIYQFYQNRLASHSEVSKLTILLCFISQ